LQKAKWQSNESKGGLEGQENQGNHRTSQEKKKREKGQDNTRNKPKPEEQREANTESKAPKNIKLADNALKT
jgi:hypothetical protein